MDAKRIQEIKNECANHIIDACGESGVLESANKDKLKGDVKTRYESATKACKKYKDKKGHVDHHIQAIFARMYGLI